MEKLPFNYGRYKVSDFTFGAELEYADVLYGQKLPAGCQWNTKDYTIVNSSGIANDPLGKLWPYGGEINTGVTHTVDGQVALFDAINRGLNPAPVINYRCNLHLHIGVPGLRNDLEALKRVLLYVSRYGNEAFQLVDPIPPPKPSDYPSQDAWKGAQKRFKRRHVSHHHMLPPARVKEALAATTINGFFEAHAHTDDTGRRLFHLSPRAGINLLQLWKETHTIEFRHWPGTTDPDEFGDALDWCVLFLHAALNNGPRPTDLYHSRKWHFPKFEPYQHDLEIGYLNTSVGHKSRSEIEVYLKQHGLKK